jgi:hypothetical protein
MKGERAQWTADPAMFYHLESLISLGMYSFLYIDEPKVTYYEKGLDISKQLDFLSNDRILNDFLIIIGGENDRKRLKALGPEIQNIVEIVDRKVASSLQTKAMLRGYVPIIPSSDEKSEDPDPKKKSSGGKDIRPKPDFIPLDHLYGSNRLHLRSEHENLFAYQYPSSLGTAFKGNNLTLNRIGGTKF